MADELQFDDEGSRLVEAINASPGIVTRRQALCRALALQPGESVLDVGSGPGHLLLDMAAEVGASGRVCGVDPSESMNGIAKSRCGSHACVELHTGEVAQLPFADGEFDAVVSSQVFEYLPDIPGALREIARVVRPGGRVLIHDTDWDSVTWYAPDRERMQRILTTWDKHLVHPHLPQTIALHVAQADLRVEALGHIPQFESELADNGLSNYLIEFIVGYVGGRDGVSTDEAEAWARDLRERAAAGHYFFSYSEYYCRAIKPA